MTHQIVSLGRGRHASPDEGACVMELASMLAGERFTDHPASVSRVIAAFLRAYNDAIDDRRRKDLYRVAADVVGTRAPGTTERARLEHCERLLEALRPCATPAWLRWLLHCLRSTDPAGCVTGMFSGLARALAADKRGHGLALALVADLISIDGEPTPQCMTMPGEPRRGATVAG